MDRFVLHPPSLRGKSEDMFAHMVRYRNTFNRNPITISEHLGVDITKTQQALIGPQMLEIDERRMLRDSALEHGLSGEKRKLARRTLNQAGLVNGVATLLTSEKSLADISGFLQLSASVAAVKEQEAANARQKKQVQAAEEQEKAAARAKKAQAKMAAVQQVISTVLARLDVANVDCINSYSLLEKLTGKQLDAVHWFKTSKGVTGVVDVKRAAVARALGLAMPAP
jgi:hypothetical protein